MKVSIIVVILFFGVVQSQAQTPSRIFVPRSDPSPPSTPETLRVASMKRIIKTGYIGDGAVQLHRMGDQAAVYINQAVGSTKLGSQEIANVIQIVRTAYEHPLSINLTTRAPKATMFLLGRLLMTAPDEAKQLITDAQTFVTAQAAKVGAMTADN